MHVGAGSARGIRRWAMSQASVTSLTRRSTVDRKGQTTPLAIAPRDKSDKLPNVTFGRVGMTVQRSRIPFVDQHSSEELQ